MSLFPLNLQPGIYTEVSDRAALNRYKSGLNIRFYKGFAEKIKGWTKAISDATFMGICRSLLSWSSLDFAHWIGLGTHLKLYVSDGATYYDITPLFDSGTLAADPFATTNGSHTVTVTDVAHGLVAGQYVHFTGATAVATLDMNSVWVVDVVVDADTYSFQHTGTANATTTGGGAAVAYEYELEPGLADSLVGAGWGGGAWGVGTWGTIRLGVGFTEARIWSLDNWGEDLIASPTAGAVYTWVKASGPTTRAVIISAAPIACNIVLVTDESRQIVTFGTYDASLGVLDPMLINWCASEDYTDWTASSTNNAGSERLSHGNAIIAALKSRGNIVIITDRTLYSMEESGDAFVFNFHGEGEVIGAVGKHCAVDIGGTVYYMGMGQFLTFSGQINPLECDVLAYVFGDKGVGFNWLQAGKVTAARNKSRNEILWFYCSESSNEIDRVVGYCYEPGHESWWLGDVVRTAYLDDNAVVSAPIATGTDGYLYIHETGVDADGAALSYSLETYDLEIGASDVAGQGEMIAKVRRVIPDFNRIAGTHQLTLKGRKYPNGAQTVKTPVAFTDTSTVIGAKIRARQVALLWEGSAVGSDIALGQVRIDVQGVSRR